MSDPENNSLLGDILAAASSTDGADTTARRTIPSPTAASAPSRARIELEDLLRLNDEHWGLFLAAVAPDDLVVICKAIIPAWRTRVFAHLDQVSADWLKANVAALDDVAPALVKESRDRAMANVKRLIRTDAIVVPEPPAAPVTPVTKANESKHSATKTASNIKTATPDVATAISSPTGDEFETLFADLLRLRKQSGVAALAALANDVADPFLQSGLCLIAAGLPAADLERALDSALARQAENYLDQLTRMRARLLALAQG